MKSTDIRSQFLDFFAAQGHQIVPSSSLVPHGDPTLLFTNAGMVQFKDVFLGLEQRPYRRAASAQRCVRAGGKHNDLDNVGYTARHHTFFEMLGNFSFGDYFKRDAIRFAWTFLTEVLRLPAERLWVTVHPQDDEAAEIWLGEIGVPKARFRRIPGDDNFWSMGDVGPCGPCTEIFYDHGPEVAGGPPGSPDADGDRYIEIWNLVFMQYERLADGSLRPLPRPSVDTGMGLERLAAVLQGVHDNYDTDIFRSLIDAAARVIGTQDLASRSLRVIADHIRSSAFLIADGVLPSNEGRGYVLRRIIRRAARHGARLGATEPFFHRLVAPLVDAMGDAYPELAAAQAAVETALREEEERFAQTLSHGLAILERDMQRLGGQRIPGETIFKLYDTYGFPVDLTADIARERGLELDLDGFEQAMAQQRERARAASQFHADEDLRLGEVLDAATLAAHRFTGYEREQDRARVVALLKDGEPVERIEAGQAASVVLDHTPFYAESGGQVGDSGVLEGPAGTFAVTDTRKEGAVHVHLGALESGALAVGDEVTARVDTARRTRIRANHSATHLLHAALRQVLGPHVTQKGSLVDAERLRFDFSHGKPVSADELARIESLVNAQIRANAAAEASEMALADAQAAGAMALFGEKYGERVRVLRLGDFSVELCGGTHVARTGDIGLFKIVSESAVAAGVRRIEAVAGEGAIDWLRQADERLRRLAATLQAGEADLLDKLEHVLARQREQEKELERLRARLASQAGDSLLDQAVEVAGAKVLAAQLDIGDAKALREQADRLRDKLGSAVLVLAGVDGDKVSLVAAVSADLTARVKAGELVNAVAQQVGGKGGGRADMAMAGGNQPQALPAALAGVADWVRERLA
ncbi:alanine--tRNA ligase [Immundisolibacter sp.]|uniref:alanine--tRNA ligase n=1 Tax=Immundisolibacter sp. TaxID=1934948 RepID=UPI00261B6DBC|nr:alanine--tRNA ligase [Immundisolibacter sp.]MDD3650298.1 alanine--tRNA ligase [Immundisolibacter sp.]